MLDKLDHLVIGASTLAQGVAYVQAQLGVAIPYGGKHPLMGTHNHLMQLGDGVFLEVIAIDRDAPVPPRPRWYSLDDPFVQQQLKQQPQLLGWVVNSPNIAALQQQTLFAFGERTPVTRGDLSWLFGLPDDGRLLAGGMLPYLIEWQTETHPAGRMADLGCRLEGLVIYHARPRWLTAILADIGAISSVKVVPLADDRAPYLAAQIKTPSGTVWLRSAEF